MPGSGRFWWGFFLLFFLLFFFLWQGENKVNSLSDLDWTVELELEFDNKINLNQDGLSLVKNVCPKNSDSNTFQTLSRHYPNIVQTPSWYCSDTVQRLSWQSWTYFPGMFNLFWTCPYTVQTLSRHCPDTVQTLSWHSPDTVQTLSRYSWTYF